MKKYKVIKNWVESYADPIRLKKGQQVIIDLSIIEHDAEWANWLWCIAENGLHGWVPSQILNVIQKLDEQKQIAVALEDYSAYELTVAAETTVVGSRLLNGWVWCKQETAAQEGWVPLRNLAPISQ